MPYKNKQDQLLASRKHYLNNKQKYLKRNVAYRDSIRKFVQEIKENTPCHDCGNFYPYYVMDFDHINASEKENGINFLSSTGRIGALKKEIVKCELVCANCHRQRTHMRALRTRSSVD